MSLIRQFCWLLAVTLVVAVGGGALVSLSAARGYLAAQLALKNSDNAQVLALTLSQQQGDAALAALTIAAQFDIGFYQSIHLRSPDGRTLVLRQQSDREADRAPTGDRPDKADAAPAWFIRAVPIQAAPGLAQVSDGWRPVGTLEVVSASGFAHHQLWQGTLRTAALLGLLGLGAGLVGAGVLARLRAPLAATVAQAEALVARRFVTVPEPAVPELRQLSRAMNTMVTRLQALLAEQAQQIDELQQQTQRDGLTGLSQRAHWLGQVSSMLHREDGPASGLLVLVRLRDLATLNRDLGRPAVDAVLRALAAVLSGAEPGAAAGTAADPSAPATPYRSTDADRDHQAAGRLNGADLALCHACWPGPGAAHTAAALRSALATALQRWPGAAVAVGAVGWQHGDDLGHTLQRADQALARAEAGAGWAVDTHGSSAPDHLAPAGETAWRQSLQQALQRSAGELASHPVLDQAGRLLHLEAPLRLRLQAHGPAVSAATWLPWALRSGLSADIDLLAVRLALAAITRDGQARGVNLALHSLATPGFVGRLRLLLGGHGLARTQLWLELGESAAERYPALLGELAAMLKPLGCKLGLEHAGARLAQLDRLCECGLDYVKLDASLSLGLADDAARTALLRRLLGLLHSMGLQVLAEGVQRGADAAALWACGIDGITGPWASAQAPALPAGRQPRFEDSRPMTADDLA